MTKKTKPKLLKSIKFEMASIDDTHETLRKLHGARVDGVYHDGDWAIAVKPRGHNRAQVVYSR